MTSSSRPQGILLLALLLAAAPFGAGVIRAVQTGSDMRLLWMALAALAGGLIAIAVGTRREASARAFALVAFILSAALTVVAGQLLGARSGPGVVMIAMVFGLCWAASGALLARWRGGRLS
jgi:hypothetical protein